MRKPILLAASIVAAVVILLVVLFAALNPSGSAKGTARIPIFPLTSTSTATSTPTGTSTAVVTTTSTVDPDISAVFPNPGFEDGFTGWERGYIGADGGVTRNLDVYTVDIDHSVAHSGTASARIAFTDTNRLHQPKYGAYISTRIPADIFRGKRVRLSAYMRTVSATVGIELWMKVPGTIEGTPTDPYIPMSWDDTGYGHRNVIGTKDWVNEAMVLDIPPEADYLVFGVRTGNYGQAWVDDVRLEVVGPDVPTTGQESWRQGKNLDFEQGLSIWETSPGETGKTEVGTSREAAHSGKLGAYIMHTGGGEESLGGLTYPIIYGQYYRDKKLSVSAYVNLDKAPMGVTLYLEALYMNDSNDQLGSIVTSTVRLLPSAPDAQGWQRIEGSIDMPHRVWGLSFGMGPNGDGDIWIDDVQIDTLGPVPTPTLTPLSYAPPARIDAFSLQLSNQASRDDRRLTTYYASRIEG